MDGFNQRWPMLNEVFVLSFLQRATDDGILEGHCVHRFIRQIAGKERA